MRKELHGMAQALKSLHKAIQELKEQVGTSSYVWEVIDHALEQVKYEMLGLENVFDNYDNDIERLQNRVEDLEAEVQELRWQLDELRS